MNDPNAPARDSPFPSASAASEEATATGSPPPEPPLSPQRHSALRDLAYDIWRAPFDFIASMKYKLAHLPQINYDLAQRMSAEGRLRDAILRYRITLWLAPNFQLARYHLGTCYLAAGDPAKAMANLRQSFAMNPNHAETNFMIDMIDPDVLPASRKPATMPPSIAVDYFNRMAPTYDASQLEMKYRGHVLADDALREFVEPGRINHHLLDLGCGTGLVGALLGRITERAVGVDLSRAMLERAQLRRREDSMRIYSETILQDMRIYLADAGDQFELITAVHVFNYMGDVSAVFEQVPKRLVDRGLFLFQTEPYSGSGYGLIAGLGRYGHSEALIESLIARAGLTLLKKEKVEVYPSYPLWQWVTSKTG